MEPERGQQRSAPSEAGPRTWTRRAGRWRGTPERRAARGPLPRDGLLARRDAARPESSTVAARFRARKPASYAPAYKRSGCRPHHNEDSSGPGVILSHDARKPCPMTQRNQAWKIQALEPPRFL
ncbi:hypothetical protein Z043_106924 [Scleropages formosus]|uniref:Uncharacterized protein n=1 Tax=Scleropages formosus TaxID=113540 RepID=A0A0P7UVE7_SCLFO|nr:hypothetical protein Z043_106924 [Scleropages formosus]